MASAGTTSKKAKTSSRKLGAAKKVSKKTSKRASKKSTAAKKTKTQKKAVRKVAKKTVKKAARKATKKIARAPAKKAASKKAAPRKSVVKKAAAKKTTGRKAPARKAPARKVRPAPLSLPGGLEAQTDLTTRQFQPPPGMPQPTEVPKYKCPQCDYAEWGLMIGETIPLCPIHHIPLLEVD